MALKITNATSSNLSVGDVFLTAGASTTVGFLTAALQNAITDGKLVTSGTVANSPTQNSSALTDSSTGTAGTTVNDSTASYSQSITNNNNATIVGQINKLVGDVAQLGNALNSIITAGNLNVNVE